MPRSGQTRSRPGGTAMLAGERLTEEGAAPHTFFKKGILVIRGYRFDKPLAWGEPGSARLIAEGVKLEGHNEIPVVARIGETAGLDRETHILGRLAKSLDGAPRTLRTIDIYTIPPWDGGVKVLIVKHPGDNALSQYFPMIYRRLFLLPNTRADRRKAAQQDLPEEVKKAGDINDGSVSLPAVPLIESDGYDSDENKARLIDLPSFIHFALQATQCVESMHAVSVVHGDIRPSSFHWQESDDLVRFAHFSQRAIHLDTYGGSSQIILESARLPLKDQEVIKDILCFMAPEQTGRTPGGTDYRSDLYGLGATFWRLLTGRRMFPGKTVREVLSDIVYREAPKLEDVRPDVPSVISRIVHKLLAKNPAARYASVNGLKEDLLECHRNLGQGWTSDFGTVELISDFPLGRYDRYSFFHIENDLLGRDNEAQTIQRCIKEFSTRFRRTRKYNSTRSGSVPSYGSSDTRSQASTPSWRSGDVATLDPLAISSNTSDTSTGDNVPTLQPVHRVNDESGPRALVVRGPAGSGKSSLVLRECLREVNGNALLGQAKFDPGDTTPYSAILECLSIIFRQFLTLSNAEIFSFGETLRERLGPQMSNITLLYSVVPELEELVTRVWANGFGGSPSIEALGTAEARVRFENLMVDILAELSTSRMIVLFLDDLQNADGPSLSLIEAFSRARVNILILGTLRSDHHAVADRLVTLLGTKLVFVNLQPLPETAVLELVARTLHIESSAAEPLAAALVKHSRGNAFAVRSLLMLLRNEDYIVFHWASNSWTFDSDLVDDFLESRSRIDPNNVDATFVAQHLQEMPISTQRFLSVAATIGPTFDIRLVSAYMEASDQSDSESSDDGSIGNKLTHTWVSGLQSALSETMITSRGRDTYSFSHDRYREASLVLAEQQPGGVAAISAKLVDMLLEDSESERDAFKISDYILRCIPALLGRPNRQTYINNLVSAGSQAFSRGALESSLLYYDAAFSLFGEADPASQHPGASGIMLKLAELLNWKGDFYRSDQLLSTMTTLSQAEKVIMLQTKARNLFSQKLVAEGMECLLDGLRNLGVHIKSQFTQEELKTRHLDIRERIINVGIDHIKNLPLAEDETHNLQSVLLSEVYTFAYFTDPILARMIAYEAISLAFEHGLSKNHGMAFISYACVSIEFEDFLLGNQVGRMALDLSLRLSTNVDRARTLLFFVSLLAPSDSVHFMQTWSLAMQGYKFARAGGDPLFMSFGSVHLISNRFFTSQPIQEIISFAEEIMLDLSYLPKGSEVLCLVTAFRSACRALAGRTFATSADTIYDTDDWNDREYVKLIQSNAQTADNTLNWYHSFRLCALYSLGFYEAAIELSEFTSSTQHHHPGHRHVKLAHFYSGLALCASIHEAKGVDATERLQRAKAHLVELAVLMNTAEANIGMWFYLLSAEIASIEGPGEAIVLYDNAIGAAEKGQWTFEHGWALFLAGSHFHRVKASNIAHSFWQQGLQKFKLLGALGVVSYLSTISGPYLPIPIFEPAGNTKEMAIQTGSDDSASETEPDREDPHQAIPVTQEAEAKDSLERMIQHLPSKDLASLINSLQAITTDVNLSSSLERLTALMMETTAVTADAACIIVRDDDYGDFRLHTHQQTDNPCVTFEPALPLDQSSLHIDTLIIPVIQHALHSGEAIHLHSIEADPRFRNTVKSAEASTKSVLALPVRSRGITLGALYVASAQHHAFSERDRLVMNLLATQAAVVISNGFLFASLKKSTQANIRAITEQRTALEAARKSQEAAQQATRVKSIFLANMSHEMRTPFASFYGLLGLLAETDLNAEQLELVGTARQSCELLLETISALLDFSKLEAHAVKLNITPVSPTELIADCQELLLTLATQKGLELTYDVETDVPPSVNADGPRIRQVLQNLIGNALKFTPKGMVDARVSVDKTSTIKSGPTEIILRIEVSDTGIGMSRSDLGHLFKPFSQVDQSATKRFGGTGLGLSICRELLTLMRGDISVTSDVGLGSTFVCLIPVEVSSTPSSRLLKQIDEIETLRQVLTEPVAANILAYSPYASTRSLLKTALHGLQTKVVSTLDEVKAIVSKLQDLTPTGSNTEESASAIPEAIILDAPHLETEEIHKTVGEGPSLRLTRIVQLYVRTAETLHHTLIDSGSLPRRSVLRCPKPLRPLAILRLLVQGRTETPLIAPLALPMHEAPTVLMPTPSVTPTNGHSPPEHPAPPPIRKTVSAPPPTRPIRQAAKLADHFNSEQLELFKTVRILIAEDNPVAQKLLFRQLSNLGFIVTATSHGQEAIDRWKAQAPGFYRVALFDHHMPVCDGLTAARSIRKLEREKGIKGDVELPIISLTADAQSQAKEDCLAAGMQLYLTKPLRPDDLLRVVFMFVLGQDEFPPSPSLA